MCGITGIFAFNLVGKMNMIHLANATRALEKRGPDFQDMYHDQFVGLGHRRLSIIDTSAAANQPMWDETNRYAIVYNGEIFNYRELRKELQNRGVNFFSQSDTEVLLKLYIHHQENFLNKLNGFFAFCIYDIKEQTFFLARDRYGVKPLLYLYDEDKFLFASEMKSILEYGIEKKLDFTALYTYLQLNYIPAPDTIFQQVKKLSPGNYLKIEKGKFLIKNYYTIPYNQKEAGQNPITYDEAKNAFKNLIEASVQRRLVADVPLGAFLSGGIDSSVVTGLAARHKPDLHTFSIGFKDEKFFDETNYANLVSKHFNTKHTVFSLTNADLYEHVYNILNYIDEPFADSSAINVYILSKETRNHATVALSGDGADELLGGYNKHAAFLQSLQPGWKEKLISKFDWLWQRLPQSRNNALTNLFRQLARYSYGLKHSMEVRYWLWASLASDNEALALLHPDQRHHTFYNENYFTTIKSTWLKHLHSQSDMNDILLTDMELVLPNDMLTKVDLMSMANSLEVRTPFLDYELVNFVFSLPAEFKINSSIRKRILQDAFKDFLPEKLYNRPKKGFEVPLLKWLRKEMKSLITDNLLEKRFIEEQGIFNIVEVEKLKKQLFSSNPGDVHARIWGLVVFQWWWKKYMN
ncbi:MAG: asparagine synthase (glutamine-hydrolyzing) [Flammeovirgaceae bacterium]|nr:MAG: asparagine synthase (glutamine-hydrolyzing) [Flammeovirgaceae bacterium]